MFILCILSFKGRNIFLFTKQQTLLSHILILCTVVHLKLAADHASGWSLASNNIVCRESLLPVPDLQLKQYFFSELSKNIIMAKTYGEKPIIFSFEEGGDEYMIGSEVSQEYLQDKFKLNKIALQPIKLDYLIFKDNSNF